MAASATAAAGERAEVMATEAAPAALVRNANLPSIIYNFVKYLYFFSPLNDYLFSVQNYISTIISREVIYHSFYFFLKCGFRA